MTETSKFSHYVWEVPPFRPLDDYLLEFSRFQLPNYKDLGKWNNRVINNLVYYQTNYFFTCIAILLIMLLINPTKMLIGMATLILMFGMFCLWFKVDEIYFKLRGKFHQIEIIYTIICGLITLYTLNSVIYALFGILLSLCVIFAHASLRLRNMKNKLANKVEGMGLKCTPMGFIFNFFGMEAELIP